MIINHFRSTKPVIGPLVGALTPITRYLGWDASLRLSEAFAGVPVHIEKCFKTSPFSLFDRGRGTKPAVTDERPRILTVET